MAADEEAAAEEEHPDEIGKRIAAQWTTDPEAAGDSAREDSSAPVAEDGPGVEPASPTGTKAGSEAEQPKSVLSRLKGAAQSITTAFSTGSKPETGTDVDTVALEKSQALVKQLTESSRVAVEAHNAKSGELRDKETKLKAVQQLVAHVGAC